MRVEPSIAEACHDLMSLALSERLPKGKLLLVGAEAAALSSAFESAGVLAEPMMLDAVDAYDCVVCVSTIDRMKSLRVMRLGGVLYCEQESGVVRLDGARLDEAESFIRRAGLDIGEGDRAALQLEMDSFLAKAMKALRKGGSLFFIELAGAGYVAHLARAHGFKEQLHSLSGFIAGTGAGRMSVVSAYPYFAHSLHPVINEHELRIIAKKCKSKVVPALELKKVLDKDELLLVEPYFTRFHELFEGWSTYLQDLHSVAQEIESRISDEEYLSKLYSTVFIAEGVQKEGFVQRVYAAAEDVVSFPIRENPVVLELLK
ncbi:MAG: hypothetical protein JW834_01420 [Candidatus Diapherotrites archaeon]|nr:hypothetical protein [Candidatus Diapherotrites archaeon]